VVKVRQYTTEREETLHGKWCTEESMQRDLKYSATLGAKDFAMTDRRTADYSIHIGTV
jgi:hypothetical protein